MAQADARPKNLSEFYGNKSVENMAEIEKLSGDYNGAFPDIPNQENYSTISLVNGIETVPTAVACIRTLREAFAFLSLDIVTDTPYPQVAKNHPLRKVLRRPNDEMSETQYKRWVAGQVYSTANAFTVIERNTRGVPIKLTPAYLTTRMSYGPGRYNGKYFEKPVRMKVPVDNRTFSNLATRDIWVERKDVLHFTDESYDPFTGVGRHPLKGKIRNPIGLYKLIMMRYLATLVLGHHVDRYLETESLAEYNAYEATEKEQMKGPQNSRTMRYIPAGSKIHNIGRSPVELATKDMLSWLNPQICAGWGVPLFALGLPIEGNRGVRQDLREQYMQFVRSGLGTQAKQIEDEFNYKFLGYDSGYKVRFNLHDLTMGTLEQQAITMDLLVQKAGLLKVNEGREFLGYEPVEGGDVLRSPTGAPSGQQIGEDVKNELIEGARDSIAEMLGSDFKDFDFNNPDHLSNFKNIVLQ